MIKSNLSKSLLELGKTKTQAMNIMMLTGIQNLRDVCNDFKIEYEEKDSTTKLKQKIVDYLGLSSKNDKGKNIIISLDIILQNNSFDVHVMDKKTNSIDNQYDKLGLTSEESSKYVSKLITELKTTNIEFNVIENGP